ncbi:esterase-like activity of phytase family protein [Nitrospira sp. T9]|uniref:esterase-like activity of phytase family protein n=1 Tax=unclassified Nitrospira TaxID=2652172 RepID=UPI003F9C1720
MTVRKDVAQPEPSWSGTKPRGREVFAFIAGLAIIGTTLTSPLHAGDRESRSPEKYFRRIATFPVFLNSDVNTETVAEILTASENGRLLIYTDSQTQNIGFVDISDPSDPQPDGTLAVGGEPTSVTVVRKYALAVVNTSENFVNTSGVLQIINLKTRQIVRSIDLGGQPDSIAVSPDGKYATIAIENERDEELGNGEPPQSPPGFVVIVDLKGHPKHWTTRTVDLVGIPTHFPTDPEPEFIDINQKNIAVVTLQENNHLALIDLQTGKVINHWEAGTVDLTDIDTNENDLIELNSGLNDVRREPDAVKWISKRQLATADEGDLVGGSRGFTIFNTDGDVRFTSGHSMEHLMARIGHYPEARSENKGNEPEGIEYGDYGRNDYLFVGSERSSVITVYRLRRNHRPEFLQVLPTGNGPEGLKAIPHRNLLVSASENDDRGAGFRSVITLYKLGRYKPTYPTILSANDQNDLPIPWGALSALAADPTTSEHVYTAQDSFYKESRLFKVDVTEFPAVITQPIILRENGHPVNLDIEGLAVRPPGGFWVASEGGGSVDDPERPVTSLNELIRVADDGTLLERVPLPDATNAKQRRFGFEGVATVEQPSGTGEFVYVAIQREWVDDPEGYARIARYDTNTKEWAFFYYPLDPRESPNGGWVGLSEIVAVGPETFWVIERDNQAGSDARIKKIYAFSVNGIDPVAEGGTFPILTKSSVRDLIPDLQSPKGAIIEKVEGLTVLPNGNTLIATDNDGVDGSNGETQFINLGRLN